MHVKVLVLLVCLGSVACSKPNEEHLIQAAIEHSYPSIYSDLSELRKDYPGFTPRIRRWSDNLIFLFGGGLYAVQMPGEEVLVTANGKVRTTRTCGSEGRKCTLTAPRKPLLGVVGTVQMGAPNYPVAANLKVSWKGAPGEVRVVGNCFAAFKSSPEPLELLLKVPGHQPIVIKNMYGYRLIAATADSGFNNYYSSMRIPESMFLVSKMCTKKASSEWPNVGGWAWKR